MPEIIVKYIGGPKDGELDRQQTEGRIPKLTMAMPMRNQTYLIRRKLVVAIYRFERWASSDSGSLVAEFEYQESADYPSALQKIESHRGQSVDLPDWLP